MTVAVQSEPPVERELWPKALAATALTVLADLLFYPHDIGWTLGLFALAWTLAAVWVNPELRGHSGARWAAAMAGAFALLQMEAPTFLGWILFCVALGVAVLLPRAGRTDDAWQWLQRLAALGAVGLVGPLLDAVALHRRRGAGPKVRVLGFALNLALPVAGGVVFLGLFAMANPLIETWLSKLELPELDPGRAVFWGFVLVVAWGALRPRFLKRTLPTPQAVGDSPLPGVSVASVTLSLLLFNALFAVQNGLDVAFLWNGASLPEGVTLAQYAHRGAYPLIVTALLAGLFVLVALAPGSATSRRPLIRALVIFWVLQNILLVASSILRTMDYVEAYSLTRFRIAALLWMGLVAVGLGLILWRMLREKSASWLLNANVLAAGVVLAAACVLDLGGASAAWNVRHGREIDGRGAAVDLGYLRSLGDASVVSLAKLEGRPLTPEFRDRVAAVRSEAMDRLAKRQADWRSWTWRGHRRLQRASAVLAARPPYVPAPGPRRPDGTLIAPPSAAPR